MTIGRGKGRVAGLAASACLWIALAGSCLASDGGRGEDLFSQCKNCHEVGEGARNKVGPHLDGIMGRVAGTIDGFKYSKAMREAGEAGLVWSPETLSDYLEKPRSFIKGNRMSYRGMSDPDDRAALMSWLAATSAATPGGEPEPVAASADDPATSFTDIVLAMEGDPDYGEYLAGECVTCHQASGHADGIPSIVGLPRDYFIRALFEYKTNVRSNEVMKLRVTNLVNDEIAALAAYFSQLEPQ